ncbi:hypothetical protein [Limnoglobus roseus]|uniref:Uncharacterized protein n=1 Tax=Limnoglobus roseus TaxID=2598579 RepID=A0A5C1AG52_9BACT|nr:hypothetical protein [Limnoglobus roseus]QEL16722.1 hypothetical protein PX52LOC_03688 [Limnoglobus roseus]
MNEDLILRSATVKDIQLELLRRTRFNALDGKRVVASLFRHRHLWRAVVLDRPGVPNYAEPAHLLTGGLIKLRDLPDDIWNADTLFISAPSLQDAEALAKVIDTEDWGGEVQVFRDQAAVDSALGTGRLPYGLLSVWWD